MNDLKESASGRAFDAMSEYLARFTADEITRHKENLNALLGYVRDAAEQAGVTHTDIEHTLELVIESLDAAGECSNDFLQCHKERIAELETELELAQAKANLDHFNFLLNDVKKSLQQKMYPKRGVSKRNDLPCLGCDNIDENFTKICEECEKAGWEWSDEKGAHYVGGEGNQ